MREDQTFIPADELKAELAKLDAHYDALAPEVKDRGIMHFAFYPPVDDGFLISRLWDKYMSPHWRERQFNPEPQPDSEASRQILKEMESFKKSATPISPGTQVNSDQADHLVVERKVYAQKGKWQRFPPEERNRRKNVLGGRLRISSAVEVEFLYRDLDLKIPPRVDCTVLFAGPHLEQILTAYKEAVRLFSEIREPAELLEQLQASADVQRIYESRLTDGRVCIEMRDSVFREPGRVEELKFTLRILAGKRTLLYPVPLARFAALGNLFPLLLGHHDESAIETRLNARLTSDDAAWALELLAFLKSEGCLARVLACDTPPPSWTARPGVTLLSHSSLLVQSERSAVLIDPVVWKAMGNAQRTFDILRTPLGAICCSHSHWDHCHFQTLLWLDKDVPILIPQVRDPSMLNPPMAYALRSLGFTDVREVRPWTPVRIEDIEIIPVPFRGEQDEPDFEMDHYTYVVRTAGVSLYGGVDCYRSSNGDMRPIVERVGQMYRPDAAFLPVSRWICHYKFGGVNAFCRYLNQEMLEQSFQYTGGPEDAADWSVLLRAPTVVPYATFTFERAKILPEIVQFGQELHRHGIGRRFYPMRPLDSLTAADLGNGVQARSRRWRLVAWSRGVGGLYRLGRRAGVGRAYRYLRHKLHV